MRTLKKLKPLTRKALTAIAVAGAMVGGALTFSPGIGKAAAFGGGAADLVSINSGLIRRGGSLYRCSGECEVATAEADDFRSCPLKLTPKASHAACLTALNAACTTTCKSTPSAP